MLNSIVMYTNISYFLSDLNVLFKYKVIQLPMQSVFHSKIYARRLNW